MPNNKGIKTASQQELLFKNLFKNDGVRNGII